METIRMTAAELIKESGKRGVPIKYNTLRKYIKLGLLPYPENRGQYIGYYDSTSLEKIKIIQKLVREHHFSMLHIVEMTRKGVLSSVMKMLSIDTPKKAKQVTDLLKKGLKPKEIDLIQKIYGTLVIEDLRAIETGLQKNKYALITDADKVVSRLEGHIRDREEELALLHKIQKSIKSIRH